MLRNVLILGGTGFVGSAVANRLCARDCSVLVPTRHLARARHLLPLPKAEVVEADIHDERCLADLMDGMDAVVNLVGVLHSPPGDPYGPAFARAHVELPRRIVAAARRAGVKRLVHVSALGADATGSSAYQRSKAAGEAVVRESGLQWTLLQPSVIFGADDHFLNLFARLVERFPVLPLAGADCRFQPVFVGDVAEVLVRALTDPAAVGQSWALGGHEIFTLRQLVEWVGRAIGRRPRVIGLPRGLGMLQARLLELLPNPPMSRDNVRSMDVDNVLPDGVPPLPYGMLPVALTAEARRYLAHEDAVGRYAMFRQREI